MRKTGNYPIFEKYGKEATEIAYKKKRSTIFLWKQKLKKAGGNCQHWLPWTEHLKTSGTE